MEPNVMLPIPFAGNRLLFALCSVAHVSLTQQVYLHERKGCKHNPTILMINIL